MDLPVLGSGRLGGKTAAGCNQARHRPTDSARAPHDDQQTNIVWQDRSGLDYWSPLRWCEVAADVMNRLSDTYTGCSFDTLHNGRTWHHWCFLHPMRGCHGPPKAILNGWPKEVTRQAPASGRCKTTLLPLTLMMVRGVVVTAAHSCPNHCLAWAGGGDSGDNNRLPRHRRRSSPLCRRQRYRT